MTTLLLLLACAGTLDFGRATPLPPGEVQFGASAAVTGPLSEGSNAAVPSATAGVRGGVAPGWEVGGTVLVSGYVLGASFDTKVALTPVWRSGFHLALNPRVGAGGLALSGVTWGLTGFNAELPVLFGFDIGKSQLVVAPIAGIVASSEWRGYGALTVGIAIPLGRWELGPSLSVASWAPTPGETVLVAMTGGLRLAVNLE